MASNGNQCVIEPRWSKAAEQERWDEKYRDVDTDTAVARVHHACNVPIVRVLRRLVQATDVVLEAGSGSGRLANHISYHSSATVVAADFSTGANQLGVRTARELGCSSIFISGDLTRLPFQQSVFDLVFSDSVIEHLEDTEAAIVEMGRVTKPGGRIVITTPNRLRPDGWDLYKRRFNPPYLQKSFRPKQLKGMFTEAGMVIESTFGDTLLLPRSFRRSTAAPPSVSRATGEPSPQSGRSAYMQVERLAEHVVPPSLWVNIGIVARKP